MPHFDLIVHLLNAFLMFQRCFWLCLLLLAFFTEGARAEKLKNESYRFDIEIPDGWQIQNSFPETSNCVLTFANQTTLVAIYVNSVDEKESLYNIQKIRTNRHELFIPPKSQLIQEDLLPFYDFLRDRIVRTFQLSDGTYLKQRLIVRSNALFIINTLNINNDFSESDAIINTLNLHSSIQSSFYLLRNNIQSDNPFTSGAIPVAILILFAFLGWAFMHYRKTNPWLCALFGLLSLGAYAGIYLTLKSNPLFAIMGLVICFILWISLAKTKLTRWLDKMAEKVDSD